MNTFSSAQVKARFTSYQNDIKTTQKAVLYHYIEKGSYPYSGTSGGCRTWAANGTTGVPGLVPDYMKTIPGRVYTADGTYYAYC